MAHKAKNQSLNLHIIVPYVLLAIALIIIGTLTAGPYATLLTLGGIVGLILAVGALYATYLYRTTTVPILTKIGLCGVAFGLVLGGYHVGKTGHLWTAFALGLAAVLLVARTFGWTGKVDKTYTFATLVLTAMAGIFAVTHEWAGLMIGDLFSILFVFGGPAIFLCGQYFQRLTQKSGDGKFVTKEEYNADRALVSEPTLLDVNEQLQAAREVLCSGGEHYAEDCGRASRAVGDLKGYITGQLPHDPVALKAALGRAEVVLLDLRPTIELIRENQASPSPFARAIDGALVSSEPADTAPHGDASDELGGKTLRRAAELSRQIRDDLVPHLADSNFKAVGRSIAVSLDDGVAEENIELLGTLITNAESFIRDHDHLAAAYRTPATTSVTDQAAGNA